MENSVENYVQDFPQVFHKFSTGFCTGYPQFFHNFDKGIQHIACHSAKDAFTTIFQSVILHCMRTLNVSKDKTLKVTKDTRRQLPVSKERTVLSLCR